MHLNMSENEFLVNQEAGDESGGAAPADGRVYRAALLTDALAEDCTTKMFTLRANGPHALGIDPVAVHPTVEEIMIGQVATKAALGEKGSEKRTHANGLCADGLIDLEQGLGYFLCDRFAGNMPTPLEARRVGKQAADRLPDRKEKERWKDKGKAARQAARKAGADEAAVAAAGLAARTKAETAFNTAEVSLKGLARAPEPLPPPSIPSTPERAPEPPGPPTPQKAPLCPRARAALEMTLSQDAASAIKAAFFFLGHTRRGRDTFYNEELELTHVRYKHALRRLKRAYPGELCDWTEHAPERMYEWALMWEAAGHPIPAAAAAAHVLRINLQKAAAALVQRATPHFVWSVQSLGLDI
jgi:hypothetical protein